MGRRRTDIDHEDAEKVIAIVCREIDQARELITAEASWARLEQFFYEALLHQRSIPTAQIIAWADAGHPAADRAVRRYAAEMVDRGREGELLVQVKAYIVKTLLRPFVPFPRGRHVMQNLARDIWLAAVIRRVADGTGLPPTRGASTIVPSAAFFVAMAAKRKGLRVGERELNRIFWRRDQLAGALEASMPQALSAV
jgi:hypothetical protein